MAITIPQSDRLKQYTATAAQTTFAYDFSIYDQDDLTVYRVRAGVITQFTIATDYTVTGVGLQSGGNIELVVGATLNDIIVIVGDTPELRSTNFNQAGDFYKDAINTELNKQIQIDQQIRRDVDRSIRLDPTDTVDTDAVSFKLPLTADRKGKYLYFDQTTGGVEVSSAVGVSGPSDSADKEVVLFSGTDGNVLKRPGTEYMILPQGTDGQRGTPSSIVMRGNTDGENVEVYVNGGWSNLLTDADGAEIDAQYIVRSPSAKLTDEFAMSTLATGLVKNTTITGTPSIAIEGTDYYGPAGTDIPITDGGTGASTAGDARTNLGVVIGTDVQAYDATLQSMSALGTAADKYAYTTGVDTWAEGSITAFGRSLIDDAAASNARTTLGLGSISTQASNGVVITGGVISGLALDLYVADGGTGRGTATANAVLCGGVTSTAAHQSVASVGTAGQLLTSNGAGALPSFNTLGTIAVAGGGTGATTEAGARTNLELGSTNNVSFLNGDFSGTEALKIPVGTTAERPGVPADGDLRINTTVGGTEVYRGGSWINLEAAGAGLTAASQTEMEAATSTTVATTPGRQQFHPSSPKAWILFNGTGVISITSSYNITSITDIGTGDYDITITTAFSSGDFVSVATARGMDEANPYNQTNVTVHGKTTTNLSLKLCNIGQTAAVSTVFQDSDNVNVIMTGDQ